jgi:hypothetical protein
MSLVEDYESLSTRARLVLVLLGVSFLVNLGAVAHDVAHLALIDRFIDGVFVSVADAEASDARQEAIATAQLVVFVATGIFFLAWFHRAYKNLIALGAQRLRYEPGWAIGGWFVPIGNLYIPKKLANDIWRVSDPNLPPDVEVSNKTASSSGLLNWWWGLWIAGSLPSLVFLFRSDSPQIFEARDDVRFVLALDISEVVVTVLAFYVVLRIAKRQESRAGVLSAARQGTGVPTPSIEEKGVRLAPKTLAWGAAAVVAVVGLLGLYNNLKGTSATEHIADSSRSGWKTVQGSGYEVSVPDDFLTITDVEDYVEALKTSGPQTKDLVESLESAPGTFAMAAAQEIEGISDAVTDILITRYPTFGQSLAQVRRETLKYFLLEDSKIETIENTSLNGSPGFKLVHRERLGNRTFKSVIFVVEHDSTHWMIEFGTIETEYEHLRPTFDDVIDSLAFTD